MKAVILAGGRGTRLQSVISDVPKPMAPVCGRCFLDFILELIRKNGITDCILCVQHMAEAIMGHYGDGSEYGVDIGYSTEEKPMGTAGAIGMLQDRLKQTFLVVNGDTFSDIDIAALSKQHTQREAAVTIALVLQNDCSRFGRVKTDRQGYITGFTEKDHSGKSGWINAGVYMFEPCVLDMIPSGTPYSIERHLLPELLSGEEKILGYKSTAAFFDIGIPRDYFNFNRWAEKNL